MTNTTNTLATPRSIAFEALAMARRVKEGDALAQAAEDALDDHSLVVLHELNAQLIKRRQTANVKRLRAALAPHIQSAQDAAPTINVQEIKPGDRLALNGTATSYTYVPTPQFELTASLHAMEVLEVEPQGEFTRVTLRMEKGGQRFRVCIRTILDVILLERTQEDEPQDVVADSSESQATEETQDAQEAQDEPQEGEGGHRPERFPNSIELRNGFFVTVGADSDAEHETTLGVYGDGAYLASHIVWTPHAFAALSVITNGARVWTLPQGRDVMFLAVATLRMMRTWAKMPRTSADGTPQDLAIWRAAQDVAAAADLVEAAHTEQLAQET